MTGKRFYNNNWEYDCRVRDSETNQVYDCLTQSDAKKLVELLNKQNHRIKITDNTNHILIQFLKYQKYELDEILDFAQRIMELESRYEIYEEMEENNEL